MSKDNAYLYDILDSARIIQRYIADLTREEFENNTEKQDAVIRRFEIIGEAARHLSPDAQKAFPDVPWKLITGMRNILIHDYDDVDLDRVWKTAHDDLPGLIARLESYLAKNPPTI